jgi:hypothetical protein
LTVKRFAAAIIFHHQKVGGDVFIGRKALVAMFALAAAANGVARIARVDYFVLCMATMRAFHNLYLDIVFLGQ